MDNVSTCPKSSAYVVPMVIVLVLLVGIIAFVMWYYFAQLKPRMDMLVFDKMSGSVGFKDFSDAQLLIQPPNAASGESSRLAIVNPPARSSLNFAMYTSPIAGNTKQQVQANIRSNQGVAIIPLVQ